MNYQVDIQNASEQMNLPTSSELEGFAKAVFAKHLSAAEVTIRIVDEDESAKLNQTFRNKPGPTNVLAFPLPESKQFGLELLGDIVICAPLVVKEAQAQGVTEKAHWAHLVIHGILHLLGFDHIKDDDAERMEAEEITILKELGFANPYQEVKTFDE